VGEVSGTTYPRLVDQRGYLAAFASAIFEKRKYFCGTIRKDRFRGGEAHLGCGERMTVVQRLSDTGSSSFP
jgi:hypothetical protein